MSQPKWTDETIIKEIKRVMELCGITDRMPTFKELGKHSKCGASLLKKGGIHRYGYMMGLPVAVRTTKYNLVCAECGKEFVSKSATRKYCSQDCSKLAARRRVAINNAKPKKRNKEIRKMRDVRPSKAFALEQQARDNWMHYADIQKAKTLEMVGGVQA